MAANRSKSIKQPDPPAPEASKAALQFVSVRALVIGVSLVPLICYWIAYTQIRANSTDLVMISLMAVAVFPLTVLLGLNVLFRRCVPRSQPVTLAAHQSTGPEAAYLHFHDGYYYLFENEGLCCKGLNSTYRIMMGRSQAVTGPYLDKEGSDLSKGGSSLFLGTNADKIGPGQIGIVSDGGIDRFSFHYYGSLVNGVPTLGLQTVVWGPGGWPQPATDLPAGRCAILSKASGLALGIHNVSSAEGTALDQFPYRKDPFQQWNVSPTGDGYTTLSSLGTGKFMDLFQCNPHDGTKVDQYAWLGTDCQRWTLEPTSDGAYRILSKGGGTAVTLPGGAKTPQALVEGDRWKGDSSQEWLFQKL